MKVWKAEIRLPQKRHGQGGMLFFRVDAVVSVRLSGETEPSNKKRYHDFPYTDGKPFFITYTSVLCGKRKSRKFSGYFRKRDAHFSPEVVHCWFWFIPNRANSLGKVVAEEKMPRRHLGHSQKTLRPTWCPKLVTGLVLALRRRRGVKRSCLPNFYISNKTNAGIFSCVVRGYRGLDMPGMTTWL